VTFGVASVFTTVVVVAAAVSALVARHALVLITVSGGSMSPTYADGEKLLVRRGGHRRPQVGDVVVFRHPQLARAMARPDVDWLVKRVVAVDGDRVPDEIRHAIGGSDAAGAVPSGFLLVRGDNPQSLDSRHFGYVPVADVLGVSVRRRPRQLIGQVTASSL
jgi:signal peptidase I